MSGGKQSLTDVVGVNREREKELFNMEQGASPGGTMGNEEMKHLGGMSQGKKSPLLTVGIMRLRHSPEGESCAVEISKAEGIR